MILIPIVALVGVWLASYWVSPRRYLILLAVLLVSLFAPFTSPEAGVQSLGWLLMVYAIPTIVTLARKVRNAPAILLINVLAGWTIIGWFVALVWASTREPDRSPVAAT
jgi:T4 superinfection immunity protein